MCAFESEKNFIQRTQLNNEMKYLLYLEKQQKEKIMVFWRWWELIPHLVSLKATWRISMYSLLPNHTDTSPWHKMRDSRRNRTNLEMGYEPIANHQLALLSFIYMD